LERIFGVRDVEENGKACRKKYTDRSKGRSWDEK
jgi:hypothetical protein